MAVITLNEKNFESTIASNDFVIIDFWAPWCGPCKSFAPTYEKVSDELEGIVFAKINTEDEQKIAAHFQIRSIPTLMIFRENVIIYSDAGALPESGLRELISKAGELDMVEVHAQIKKESEENAKEENAK